MVPYSMYKCTKFTIDKNLITPAYFLLHSDNPGTVTLPVVKPLDPESEMLCNPGSVIEFSVDSGYSSCKLSHIVIRKPHNDLCCICQKNSIAIMKIVNTSGY